jgi:hypothetical protein
MIPRKRRGGKVMAMSPARMKRYRALVVLARTLLSHDNRLVGAGVDWSIYHSAMAY